MSTRGIIFKVDPITGDYTGRYHHSDSYPSGLGKTLWDAYHGFFKKDLSSMTKYLIDNHPSGWSNIVEADFSILPGFQEHILNRHKPMCYCHGDRHERVFFYSKKDVRCHNYSYILLSDGMEIIPNHESIIKVRWDGDEPNWENLEKD